MGDLKNLPSPADVRVKQPLAPQEVKPLRRDIIPKSQTPALGGNYRRTYLNCDTREILGSTQYQGYAPYYLN
jgi:hypothetical protein